MTAQADAIRAALEMLVGRNDRFRTRRTEALAALDELLAARDKAEKGQAALGDLCDHLRAERDSLAARCRDVEAAREQLRVALSFYGEIDNYTPLPRRVRPIIIDDGSKARAALAAVAAPPTLTEPGKQPAEQRSGRHPQATSDETRKAAPGSLSAVWSEPRQDFPGGPVYREGMATGTSLRDVPETAE